MAKMKATMKTTTMTTSRRGRGGAHKRARDEAEGAEGAAEDVGEDVDEVAVMAACPSSAFPLLAPRGLKASWLAPLCPSSLTTSLKKTLPAPWW